MKHDQVDEERREELMESGNGYVPGKAGETVLKYMKPRDKWSATEDNYIIDNFGESWDSMSRLRYLMPHRTERAIRSRARKLGILL